MVRARKKKKATINRINRLILKIILPTTNYNTNKKHITTSIYDKNENFCFSRKIIWSFSQRRLWKKKKPRIQVAFVYYNSIKNSSASYVCVSKRWFWNSTFFPKVFPPSPTRKKKMKTSDLKKMLQKKKSREETKKKLFLTTTWPNFLFAYRIII